MSDVRLSMSSSRNQAVPEICMGFLLSLLNNNHSFLGKRLSTHIACHLMACERANFVKLHILSTTNIGPYNTYNEYFTQFDIQCNAMTVFLLTVDQNVSRD